MRQQLTEEQVAHYARTRPDCPAFCAHGSAAAVLADEVQEYRALRPTCPTCFGSSVDAKYPHRESTACPDCTDGKTSLLAVIEAGLRAIAERGAQ